jgi:hypothetical protein
VLEEVLEILKVLDALDVLELEAEEVLFVIRGK